jgi:adenylate cyclase
MSMANKIARSKDSADFSGLPNLRVLGLMDVTMVIPTIPEDTENRRVRTLLEIINKAYGVTDTLGRQEVLSILDIVSPKFRDQKNECIFVMFGRFG